MVLPDILNPEGHQSCCIGSKVTAILLNEWILPTGGVALGRVCACSLRSRLVSGEKGKLYEMFCLFDY